jgi:MFS family permease
VCVAVGIFGLGETFLAPSQAALANDLASDQLRGRYNAVYTLAWTTGLLVGPAVSARALDLGHFAPLYAGLVAGCGLAAVGARRLHPRLPRDLDLVSMPNFSASGSGPDPAIG